MKRILLISAISLAALSVVSCKNEKNETDNRFPIDIQTSISSATRIIMNEDGSGKFEMNDVMGLYAQVGGAVSGNVNNDRFTMMSKLYWDDISTKDPITFSAYYPYRSTIADPTAYSFNVVSAENPDLLLSLCEPITFSYDPSSVFPTPRIEMTFRHVMHKLIVKLATVEGGVYTESDLAAADVTLLGTKPTSTVNLLTAKVTGVEGDAADRTLTDNALSHTFYVAPQPLTTGAPMIRVSVLNSATGNKESYVMAVPTTVQVSGSTVALTELESGKILTLTIRVGKVGIDVAGSTAEITAWGVQGVIDDEAMAQ